MRHAGLVLAAFFFACVQALAAGTPHQSGSAHNPHSEGSGRLATNSRLGSALRLAGAARAASPEHECFSASQTREKIAAHKLAEPFRLLMGAAHHYEAEALGVRLCRHKEQYIYEISLLRTNGRVIHVYTNAVTGQILSAKNAK
jgi:hypothetical protein